MTHGSLFSGIGGFDLAARWAGWDNLFNCEIDLFCKDVLKYHFPDAEQYGDIKTTDFTVWRDRIDVLSGGFPCQPFSQAGKRKGTEDDRYLWPEMLGVIRSVRPRWVVGENVLGIVNWSKGLVFEQVCSDLEAEGYEVQPFVIPACGVNAPHRRYRTWFVATVQTQGLKMCNGNGKTQFYPVGLLPTPCAQDGFNSGKGVAYVSKTGSVRMKNADGTSSRMGLEGVVKNMLPTPTARDFKGARTKEALEKSGRSNKNNLPDHYARTGKTSRLNPRFVAEMMGFPTDWTELPFRNGEKNRSKPTAMR